MSELTPSTGAAPRALKPLLAFIPLEIEVPAEGHVALRKPSKMPTLAKLTSQITPENRYGEISAGGDRGKEVVEW